MSTKLSIEDLNELIQLQKDYNNTVFSIGELSIKIDEAELKLSELKGLKLDYLSSYNKFVERDRDFARYLTEKYGHGSINLETGEITVQ